MCTSCNQDPYWVDDCTNENYCINPDPYCCSIRFFSGKSNGCKANLFFHPIWKKFIYCPECGLYEVKK